MIWSQVSHFKMTRKRIILRCCLGGQEGADFSPKTHPEVSALVLPSRNGARELRPWHRCRVPGLGFLKSVSIQVLPGKVKPRNWRGTCQDHLTSLSVLILPSPSMWASNWPTSLSWLFPWQMVNVKLSRWCVEKRNVRATVTRCHSTGKPHVLFLLLLSQREISVMHCWVLFCLNPLFVTKMIILWKL